MSSENLANGSAIRSLAIGWVLTACAMTFYGCSNPRRTPQIYPYATVEVPENSVTLIDKQNFVDKDFKPNMWSSVSRVKLNGEELNLESHENKVETRPQELEKIRVNDFPTTYILPVAKGKQRFVCSDAITLPNGEILILGGTILPEGHQYLHPSFDKVNFKADDDGPTDFTWYFDPKTMKVRSGPKMTYPRRGAVVIRLKDGRFLFAGGCCPEPFQSVCGVEIFDPKTNKFFAMPEMKVPRYEHSMAQLRNGKVLIVGGQTRKKLSDAGYCLTSSIEILDLEKEKVTLVGQLRHARKNAIVVASGKNQAFICGGESDETEGFDDHPYEPVQEAELYTGTEGEVTRLKEHSKMTGLKH